MKAESITLLVALLAPTLLAAQSSDEDALARAAAERERLGNQRIQVEIERRAREEQQRLDGAPRQDARARPRPETAQPQAATVQPRDFAAQPPAATSQAATAQAAQVRTETSSEAAAPRTAEAAAGGPARDEDLSIILEQLQALGELGELKDRGYLTEEEFERIKRRILAGEE